MRESTINEEEGAPLIHGAFKDKTTSDHSILFKTERSRRFLGTTLSLIAMTVVLTPFIMDIGVDDMIQKSNTNVVDVNGPPAAELAENRRKKSLKKKLKKKGIVTDEPLLIVDNNNDEVPNDVWTSATGLHASDALECRQSVINFVINATDGKDECNGLKRAFDKTCNADSPADAINKGHKRRRRLMAEKITSTAGIKKRYQGFVFDLVASVRQGFKRLMIKKQESPLFFIEDVLVGRAYRDAKYVVENDLDKVVHRALTTVDAGQQNGEKSVRHLQEEVFGEDHPPLIGDQANRTKHVVKQKHSLTLPTSNAHISEKILSETLMLQKGDTIDLAMKTISNKTQNLTEAAVDAVTSSKAIQDTTAAVSALLNDPTSIEARVCCASILNVFHEICDTTAEDHVSDRQLFLIVAVLALCGMIKSIIRHLKIRWLPEAGGCVLVGVFCGAIMSFFPHTDISFDGEWFLRIMVPPIVFEAALRIDKRSFNRHIVPIVMYAVIGTVMATVITAFILHAGSFYGKGVTIPVVESLTFGALISSIDPIAVLSVLNNIGLSDTDTIYILIFGESLLNDGVALVLYETLVHFLDESLVIDQEAVFWAVVHFFVVAFGSLCIGIGSGLASAAYYYLMQGCQNGITEVLLFFCWAFIPYYVSDGIGWSGIVTVVATGFVMDLYVVGQPEMATADLSQKRKKLNLFSTKGHLSAFSKSHVHFVAELLAAVMETAIFAYLGLFLFSYRYHWNPVHIVLAILACVVSRAIMIPTLSFLANWITKCQYDRNQNRSISDLRGAAVTGVTIDTKMQMVLWVAGLRGAMSFALVENIPLYDAVTGEGSKVKAELKAMTSASIVFTVFCLGGYTSYLMEQLGIVPSPHDSNGRGMRKKGSSNYTHGVENNF